MTAATKYAPRRPATPALALAAMLLAGCSSGNIGESWQCPLAKGGSCESVAAADPAVPDAGAPGRTVLAEPLWRQRAAESGKPETATCEAGCGGGFDPFGWLMRLLGANDEAEARPAEEAPRPLVPAAESAESMDARSATAVSTDPATLPAEPARDDGDPGGDGLRGDGLRTGEVVARIWIAPFVDADGVYREASWVRAVLEPAGWRLPR